MCAGDKSPEFGGREFADDRTHDGEAAVGDAEGGLQHGPVADLAHAVGEVSRFPDGEGKNAEDGDDADTRRYVASAIDIERT